MNILGFIGNIFKPASDMVDNLHTSEEEKLNLKVQLQAIENQLAERVIDYEGRLMRAQADIIT